MTQDKVTIQEASRALNIGRKTIYRWLDKGLISRIREGNKTFVLLSEVRAVCDKGTDKDTKDESENVTDTKQDTNTVTVERPHYEGLLIKLGQYEAERRYLLEYKTGLEAKEKEIERLKAEIERLKRPWWRRIFK